ncbi:MAG: hypothetical protein PHN56_03175 [Candidatus Nanoarchaeia archaeon]|nr:hypothetical protein [Candidatus Nanoarchaeia archaeon]
MNKQIMGILGTLLMLGTALSPTPELDQAVSFQITIVKDATISISTLRVTEPDTSLEFQLGIATIDEPTALPTNGNLESETLGYWDITNIGNTDVDLMVESSADFGTAPYLGISSKVGNVQVYGDGSAYRTLDIDPIAYNVDYTGDSFAKDSVTKFYQRVAADKTATGGFSSDALTITITSSPHI